MSLWWVTGGSWALAIIVRAWHLRGPSTSQVRRRTREPDKILPDGSTQQGDIVEWRR